MPRLATHARLGRHRLRLLLHLHLHGCYVLLCVVWLATAGCYAFGPTASSASLEPGKARVRVHYAAPQRLQALTASGDTVLTDVTIVEGRPMGLRGDTLHLRVTRWYAGGWFGHQRPSRIDLTVVPQAGTTFERERPNAAATVKTGLVIIAFVGALAAIMMLVALDSTGDNY